MQNENSRNTIIFIVCAAVILIAYQFLVLEPASKRRQAELRQAEAAQVGVEANASTARVGPVASAGGAAPIDRAAAKAQSPRIAIDTPALAGSLSLKGGRIDDLYLKDYREGLDKTSPPVEMLRPEGAEHAYFAEFGWTGQNLPGLPGPSTVWTSNGGVLSPGKPVVLTYTSPAGLVFTRTIAVDDKFMFTVTDQVANRGGAAVSLAPYASVQRQGVPPSLGKTQIVHEGAIGWLGGELRLDKYPKWKKDGTKAFDSTGGWLGVTDKYWLAALIPGENEKIHGQYRITPAQGVDLYDVNFVGDPKALAPGATLTQTTRFFAGAKTVPTLKAYEKSLGVPKFDQAVDWGMFWFFTHPMFWLLDHFYQFAGSFGVAILLLTLTVRIALFPLAQKSYESVTKMKKVQPEQERIRTQYKDDPAKQQQEIMALYGREKVNPLMGCLPMIVQIPILYSVYKVLTVTIEMRHAPFIGWIHDLSARDPSSIWTLFGLIPWNPAAAPLIGGFLDGPLHLGVWPLLYGFTMWLTTAMNPPAPDPMQQRIFQLMPIMFTFIMAPFAVGLLIYWTWSNVLSILQQYVMMRRFKVDNPIDSFLARFGGKAKAAG